MAVLPVLAVVCMLVLHCMDGAATADEVGLAGSVHHCGLSLAVADVTADGSADVVVGYSPHSFALITAVDAGRVQTVYFGDCDGTSTVAVEAGSPQPRTITGFATGTVAPTTQRRPYFSRHRQNVQSL